MNWDAKTFAVYTRAAWGSGWELQPYLRADKLNWCAAPSIPWATFSYEYGRVMEAGEADVQERGLLALLDHYVQVREVAEGGELVRWTGIIQDDKVSQYGGTDVLVQRGGTQTLKAYGLEHVLARTVIRGSKALVDDELVDLDIAMSFNERRGRGAGYRGNRSDDECDLGYYVFSTDGSSWDNYEIIRYLFGVHATDGPTWELTGQTDMLVDMEEVHQLAGRSLKEALDELIPTSMGLGWRVKVADAYEASSVQIEVFTALAEAVTVGDVTIPANLNQHDYSLADEASVTAEEIMRSRHSRYNRFVLQGGFLRTCFSLSAADETLDRDWDDELQSDYNDAEDADRREDRFRRCFAWYTAADGFLSGDDAWKAGDGEGGTKRVAAPTCTGFAVLGTSECAAMWDGPREIERALPVEKTDGEDDEYLEPLVVVPYGEDDERRWVQVDTVRDAATGLMPAVVRPLDDRLGIEVRFAPAHRLGLNNAEGEDDHFDGDSADEPLLDWQELIATVSVRTDTRLEAEIELDKPDGTDLERTYLEEVPSCEAWYVVEDTVVGIEEGELLKHDGGWVRDDSETLQALAALARSWYGEDRVTVHVAARRLTSFAILDIGYYVRAIDLAGGAASVGTLVTSITWHLDSPADQTAEFDTGYWELDIKAFASWRPHLADMRRSVADHATKITNLQAHVANLPARIPPPAPAGQVLYEVTTEEDEEGLIGVKAVNLDGTLADPEIFVEAVAE